MDDALTSLLSGRDYRFQIYKDGAGEWRWRLRSGNNKVVADSGEGYKSLAACRAGIEIVMATNAETPVMEPRRKGPL